MFSSADGEPGGAMPEQGPGLPPAGWYDDPTGLAKLRWWSGSTWTGDVQGEPVVAAPQASPAAQSPMGSQTEVALTRRQLREQVGSLTVGEEPAQTGATVAVLERAREAETVLDEDLPALERARRAAGYAPRQPGAAQLQAQDDLTWRGRTQTVSGWFFATATLWMGVLSSLLGALAPALGTPLISNLSIVVTIVLTVFLARTDGKRLKANGFKRTSAWWALVPLVYFILRVVRTGPRSIPMLVTWLLIQVLLLGVAVALVVSSPAFQAGLQQGLQSGSQAKSTTQSQSDGTDNFIPPPPAPHVITDEERAASLTTDQFPTELANWIRSSGHEVGAMYCEPFIDTSAGTHAACKVQVDGKYVAIILVATPDDPQYAWNIDSVTPYDEPSTTNGNVSQS